MNTRTRFAFFALSTAAALSTVLATSPQTDSDWPFLRDCEKHDYSKYVTWEGRAGWIDFAHDQADDQADDRSTTTTTAAPDVTRVSASPAAPAKHWASCVNPHQ